MTRFWRAVHIIDHFFGVPKVLTKIFAFFFATIYTIFIGYLLRALKASAPMGARRGGGKGGTCPLEFEKMTSYVAVLQTTLKFSHAPLALAMDTLYVSVKSRKNASIFICAFGAPKNGRFFVRRAENVSNFSRVGGFAPLWKISAGAHECPPLAPPTCGLPCLCALNSPLIGQAPSTRCVPTLTAVDG